MTVKSLHYFKFSEVNPSAILFLFGNTTALFNTSR